ncbi:MAG: hypothetical protein H6740_08540 [Alphaproteobacteria bacterium]|nr:hypothetical protein [Alphaproteobacteria bacterium]
MDPDWQALLAWLEERTEDGRGRAERLREDLVRALGSSGDSIDRLVEMLNRAFDEHHNSLPTGFKWTWAVHAWRIDGLVAIHYGHHELGLGETLDHILEREGGGWCLRTDNPGFFELDYPDIPTAIASEIACMW